MNTHPQQTQPNPTQLNLTNKERINDCENLTRINLGFPNLI